MKTFFGKEDTEVREYIIKQTFKKCPTQEDEDWRLFQIREAAADIL